MLAILDLTPEDAAVLKEQASVFRLSLSKFVTFLCVNSVCRYRANRDKNNEKSEVFKNGVQEDCYVPRPEAPRW